MEPWLALDDSDAVSVLETFARRLSPTKPGCSVLDNR